MRLLALAGLMLLACLQQTSASAEKLKSFEKGSWQQLLRAHSGHPTIVHFWGVTCGPCKVELPQLGDFMKQHPGLDFVTIDADLVPNADDAALSMLKSAGLSSAENWIFGDGFAERLRYEVDPSWQGDIPRTLMISANGRITTIEGAADPADLKKWSEEQAAK